VPRRRAHRSLQRSLYQDPGGSSRCFCGSVWLRPVSRAFGQETRAGVLRPSPPLRDLAQAPHRWPRWSGGTLASVHEHVESIEAAVIRGWAEPIRRSWPMWTDENRARYDRSGLRYPSDLTDEEWALVKPGIPRAKRGGNKRTVDVREVVNGLI